MPRTESRVREASHTTRLANQALLDAAERLVAARPDLPAGSVLRSFSRSVRAALLDGWSPSEVAAEAERRAAEFLALRTPDTGHGGLRPRRAGPAPRIPRARRPR